MAFIHKEIEELANGTASARDLNRDGSRFSSQTPIVDRLGREKFKDRDDGAASCQLFNHFVYTVTDLKPPQSGLNWCELFNFFYIKHFQNNMGKI
jgi:hypothetical protein